MPLHKPHIFSCCRILLKIVTILAPPCPPLKTNYEEKISFFFWKTYVMTGVGFCKRVFTKSRGWNRTVENVPEKEPAKKAFTNGYCNNS